MKAETVLNKLCEIQYRVNSYVMHG